MITGIGVDLVKIARMIPWVSGSQKRLLTIFSQQEIADCITQNAQPQNAAERLAARFAAKEAFYKALTATLCQLNIAPQQTFSLMFAAQHVSVTLGMFGQPTLTINWDAFHKKIGPVLPPMFVSLSLAHEREMAIAFVVISRL